ncbi:selenium metabolism-associated LysR family transcriptional regulator [Desulfobulbus alkaliphilus]|uniref:selenium metabolism-associated LysR family transcriptional regulator n=1 Tax=Desulfobulbus alkaliphilus TaxID=869814 RepID=UPI001963ED49|nr:selenium metabolism-associated LysR family transcriptional regulator [Desulfobulbus alkaliphilus]MBM9536714.1 LysR family transcriptional regulator [Desulfobulbus alkaliphilus]
MDIKKLDVFCKVVELKSFTKAAESVRLSQPTVSEHVRSLEKEIGQKLIDRLGRDVEPTPVGHLLYGHAVRMLRLQQETLQAIADYQGTLRGTLQIGAGTIPGTYILPVIIGLFCRRYPEVKPSLHISGSKTIAAGVLAGDFDLGLVGGVWNERGLDWVPVFADTLVVAVPPTSSLASRESLPVAELFTHPFILREPGSGTRRVVAGMFDQQGLREADLRDVAMLGSTEAVKEAIKAGLGLSILSLRSVVEEVRHGLIKTLALEDIPAERIIYLIQRKNREPSPIAAAFTASLSAAAHEEDKQFPLRS